MFRKIFINFFILHPYLINYSTQKCLNLPQYLKNPKSTDLINQLKPVLGKSFNEKEFEKLIQCQNQEFKESIKEKFIKKRKERIEFLGNEQAEEIEKRIFLQSIDLNWKLHIQYLEQLRQVIGLRSYGQRDPLIEYKKETFLLFENLLNKLKTDLITILINLTIIEKTNEKVQPEKKIPNISRKKIRRNEPCFCGSKKKYKHCCGNLAL